MKLKIGVLGAGHLGKIHIKCLLAAAEVYELVGFYDPNPENATAVTATFGIPAFMTVESLLEAVEVVDIVTPTTSHFEMAAKAAKHGKHIFVEKPITNTVAEAEELIRLAEKHQIKVQVGHVERFNPAFLALGDTPLRPAFIEAHRLATFNPRGTDVSVVLDLMIHDIDIILHLVQSDITSIHANGVAIVSDSPDICNARIAFANGCVANLTASRLSLKQMRKIRLFQPDAYISLDFLEKNTQILRLHNEGDIPDLEAGNYMPIDTQKGKKIIEMQAPEPQSVNAIQMELETFAHAIQNNTRPIVDIQDGYKALKVAYQVIEAMQEMK